jgi:hypothetical protein
LTDPGTRDDRDDGDDREDGDDDLTLLTSVEVELVCVTCGRALDGDPDEDPTGDAGMPICGECARERDFLSIDIDDGVLDGEITT